MSADCIAAYDRWAATYDAIDNPLIAEAVVAVDERAAWLRDARVLELGCGTGRNGVVALAAGARRYVGVDGSRGMLAEARRRVDDARAGWIEGDLIDGARRAAADERFDVALICLVLEHVAAAAPVIAAAAAALDGGGRLLAIELHPALHAAGVGANFRAGDEEVRLPSFRHDGDELRDATCAAGLRDATVRDRVPSAAALARSAKLSRYAGRAVLLELTATR